MATAHIRALLIVVGLALTGATQAPPNFSGTWRLDESRSASPGYSEYVGPVVRVIVQSPTTLVLDVTRGGDKHVNLTYALGETVPGATAGPRVNRGYFDGAQLITETIQDIQGQTVSTREIARLENGGRELVVERVVEVEHGYTLRGARNSTMVKDVFVRIDK
jgi:hypothetical protein